jgi:hypothetical protein
MSNAAIDPRGWVKNFGIVSKVPSSGYLTGFSCITTKNQVFTSGAGILFDPSQFPPLQSVKLRVVVESTGPLVSVQLYNFTSNAVVAGSSLSSSSLTPVELVTGDLSAVISATEALYIVQFKMGAGGTSDMVTLDHARLECVFSGPSK